MSDFYRSKQGAFFGTRMVEVVSSDTDEVVFREARRFGNRWFFPQNSTIHRMTRDEFDSNFKQAGGSNIHEN